MLTTNSDNCHTGTVAPETKTKTLVCNAGSSSLKFSLFDTEDEASLTDRASIGSENPREALLGWFVHQPAPWRGKYPAPFLTSTYLK
jgi:hypothetical protein